jgi:hypothetical protein
MAPTFLLDPGGGGLDGAPKTADSVRVATLVELEGERVNGTGGVASGFLPAAIASFGSKLSGSYCIWSADNGRTPKHPAILCNSDTPNEVLQHQAVYQMDT